MGKMLEALRHPRPLSDTPAEPAWAWPGPDGSPLRARSPEERAPTPTQEPTSAARPTRPGATARLQEPSPEPTAEAAVPYIEVGGPGSAIDASPDVLAYPGVRRVAAPPAVATGPDAPVTSRVPPGMTPTVSAVGAPASVIEVGPPVAAQPGTPAPAASDPKPATVEYRPPAGARPLPPPAERFGPELVAFHRPDAPLAESYRAMFAGLFAHSGTGRCQAWLGTAAGPGVGTTTVLLNLGISASRLVSRVLVVDANMDRPAVDRRLGLPDRPGLWDVLTGGCSLSRAVMESGVPNLHVLTAGTRPDGTAVLASEAMRSVLRHVRTRYEVVIIDGPVWDGRPEAAILAGACDALYLVTPRAEAEDRRTTQVVQVMRYQGMPFRGCFLTDFLGCGG